MGKKILGLGIGTALTLGVLALILFSNKRVPLIPDSITIALRNGILRPFTGETTV